MSKNRSEGRREQRRAFRPELEGQRLEARVVLSRAHAPFVVNHFLLTHPQPGFAENFQRPVRYSANAPRVGPGPVYDKGYVATQTARGGQSVIVAAPDGSRFRVSLNFADNQYDGGLALQTGSQASPTANTVTGNTGNTVNGLPQPRGTVRAYAMPGGKVGLIVDGSTEQQALTIDPLPFAQRKGFAHSFAYGESGRSHILNIGSLNVTSGRIAQILAFHSADLSGPVTVGGVTTVDRIAFNSLKPGAAIGVGGTLNTLDVNTNANLTSGPGVVVGRDLNLLNVGGDLTLANGASIRVGRFEGVTLQPPKGTGTGSNILSLNQSQIGSGTSQLTPSISAFIQGNVTIGPGSVLAVTSGIANSSLTSAAGGSGAGGGSPTPFLINGSLNVSDVAPTAANLFPQVAIPNLVPSNSFTITTQVPNPSKDGPATIPGVLAANFVARNGIYVNGVQILGPGAVSPA